MSTQALRYFGRLPAILAIASNLALGTGCAMLPIPSHRDEDRTAALTVSDIPRELNKASLPVYRIEPPDVLLIEAVHNIRPAGDPLRTGDELSIQASNLLPIDPTADPLEVQFKTVNGVYRIQPTGRVDLGPIYGEVQVAGLPVEQAQEAILQYLMKEIGLAAPEVSVTLVNIAGKQAIAGEHLVRPDGSISLGIYGSLYAAGMTVEEIQAAIEAHLSQFMHQPEVRVEVLGYNSKVYYVIVDGAGFGETVVRVPVTGNETVLDAVAGINGLPEVSSRTIWVARPSPGADGCAQTMMVDWEAITQDGIVDTNYQLFPGDRLYIRSDCLIKTDNVIAKITAPIERLFGFTLLTYGLLRTTNQSVGGGGGGNGNGGFNGGFFP